MKLTMIALGLVGAAHFVANYVCCALFVYGVLLDLLWQVTKP